LRLWCQQLANKVKLALLEKGVAFEKDHLGVGETDPLGSPLGKVPYLKTEHGDLCESTVMVEYIEQAYPAHPLMPQDPFAAAKVPRADDILGLALGVAFARNLYRLLWWQGQR